MKRLLACFLAFCLAANCVLAEEVTSDFDAWLGRQLRYDIDFLWFDSIAEGMLSFDSGSRPGTYRAVLEARTLGVAAWLTSDRVQRYVSEMELAADGSLRALSHESQIIKGSGDKRKDRSKRYLFDHERRLVSYQRGRDGKFGAAELLPMIEGAAPNDILTAFFRPRPTGRLPLWVERILFRRSPSVSSGQGD